MEAPPSPLSSRELVTFLIFSCFLHTQPAAFNLPQSRHPERSAAQNYRITDGLWRGVEGPRRCLLADVLPSFPAISYKRNQKKSQPPSEPGFPTSPLSLATTDAVLPKENHMQLTEAATLGQEIRGSRGICGSADTSWKCCYTSTTAL
jgi:hypothetical protein